MKPPKKSSCSSNPSISQLPADVIGRILTFLPIKEAVRTSILSTQWRHRWKSTGRLVFDDDFATSIPNSDVNRVMLKVHQALMFHDRPINKFELSIPTAIEECPQLDQLIHYLSTKSVNELSFLFPGFRRYTSLPAALFALPNLSILKLHGFGFEPSNLSVGFSKLTFLELKYVKLPSQFFEKLPPKCPLLQELRVINCDISNPHLVFATPSVKVLVFSSCQPFTIRFMYAPHLSVLSVLQPYYNLSHFYYYWKEVFWKFDVNVVALFGSLPALEQLNLGLDLLLLLSEANVVPYQLPALLHNLKVLEIPSLALARLKESSVLVCLIQSSPNLQKITIGHDTDGKYRSTEDTAGLQKLLKPEDNILQHLEVFTIQNSRGNRVELELVRFVLANSPVLKRVFIKSKQDLCRDTMLKFVAEVTEYKRISKEAQVKYMY